MKVLVLIDAWFPFTGGAQVQVKNLKNILESKYQVKYFLLHSPSSNILSRFLWSFLVIPQAIFIHKKHHFDLIHAHAFWPGLSAKALSLILKIPLVFTVHGSHLMDLNQKSPRAFWEKVILTKIKYDQVISVASKFLKYKNVNQKITVIPNGVDIQSFDSVKTPAKGSSSPGRRKAQPLKIIFVGRDHPHKGLKYLQKAIKQVKKVFPQARLKVISRGFKGEKLIKEYKSSHLFVLPSLAEGQPLVLLEAWAAKLPVVVTKVGDNPQMVKNGTNGYLVKPGDSKELAKAIIKVLKNKNREKIGQKGYQLVKKHYSWRQCAQKTYQVYKNTCHLSKT